MKSRVLKVTIATVLTLGVIITSVAISVTDSNDEEVQNYTEKSETIENNDLGKQPVEENKNATDNSNSDEKEINENLKAKNTEVKSSGNKNELDEEKALDTNTNSSESDVVDKFKEEQDNTTENEIPTIDNDIVIQPPQLEDNNIENNRPSNSSFMAEVEQAIFVKVNEERAKVGVQSLTYDNTMQSYARIKSQDMGDNNYFDHADLNGNYITSQMQADGVTYNAWGENIAYIGGVSDPMILANQFMNNWMNSEGHRKNILSSDFSSIGMGVYQIDNKVYATQEFYR